MMPTSKPHALVIALALATAVLVALAGCRQNLRSAAGPRIETAAAESDFVGDAACQECHPTQFDDHKDSGHGRSLRWATVKDMGEDAPAPGPIPGTSFSVKEEKGKLIFVSADGRVRQPLDIAFGAGHGGITFCTIDGPTEFTKLRISYFPREKRWRTTPGMVKIDDFQPGDTVEGSAIVGCVKCHSVTLPPNSAVPQTKFMGVGCETCHGAGSAHIQAARTPGSRDLHMKDLSTQTALELNQTCSNCHSPVNDSMLTQGNEGLLRFQPESLLASRCFAESDGKVSCSTCHDPHKRVSHDPRTYDTACLRCHSPASRLSKNRIVSASACPVNPRGDCARCHMPKRLSFHEGDIPTMMTDHQIAVHKR